MSDSPRTTKHQKAFIKYFLRNMQLKKLAKDHQAILQNGDKY